MTYQEVRDGLLSILEEVPGFLDVQVRYEDFSVLETGTAHALIITYDGFDKEPSTYDGGLSTRWRFIIHMFNQSVPTIHEARREQDDYRDAVLTKLEQFPNLNIEVFDAVVTTGRPDPLPHAVGSLQYLREQFTFIVEERHDTDFEG
jgi:hypothetical protein